MSRKPVNVKTELSFDDALRKALKAPPAPEKGKKAKKTLTREQKQADSPR